MDFGVWWACAIHFGAELIGKAEPRIVIDHASW